MKDAYRSISTRLGWTRATRSTTVFIAGFYAVRAGVCGRRCGFGIDGRVGVARVHGLHGCGRGSDREFCRGVRGEVEKATSKLPPVEDLAAAGDGTPQEVHTPNQRSIDEVGEFPGVERVHQMKTMAYIVEPSQREKQIKTVGRTRAVVVFLRGDHN